MNAARYLNDLRDQLKALPCEQQEDILMEIASHIESAEGDPAMGAESEERRQRVLLEMGTPGQMGRGMRDVHRPNHWIDLLWVWIPYLIILPLSQTILFAILGPLPQNPTAATPHLYLYGRLALLITLTLIYVGWRRRSAPLSVYWTIQGIAVITALMMREERWVPGQELIPNSLIETIVLYLALAGSIFWLVRTLRENRFDLLLVVFALQPLVLMGANVAMEQIFLPANIPNRSLPFMIPSGIPSYLFYQVGWVLGISIFFLFKNRNARWLGLLWVSFTFAYPQVFQYRANLPATILWASHIALVLLAWALDSVGRRGNSGFVVRNP